MVVTAVFLALALPACRPARTPEPAGPSAATPRSSTVAAAVRLAGVARAADVRLIPVVVVGEGDPTRATSTDAWFVVFKPNGTQLRSFIMGAGGVPSADGSLIPTADLEVSVDCEDGWCRSDFGPGDVLTTAGLSNSEVADRNWVLIWDSVTENKWLADGTSGQSVAILLAGPDIQGFASTLPRRSVGTTISIDDLLIERRAGQED